MKYFPYWAAGSFKDKEKFLKEMPNISSIKDKNRLNELNNLLGADPLDIVRTLDHLYGNTMELSKEELINPDLLYIMHWHAHILKQMLINIYQFEQEEINQIKE